MIKRLLIGFGFLLFPSLASANCVVGATGVVGTGTCSKSGGVLIATQTASSGANIQFSGSNFSNSYQRLRLECSLTSNVDSTIYVVLGEGAGPTWQTAALYFNEGISYGLGTAYSLFNRTASGIVAMNIWGGNIATLNMSLDSPGSSSYQKVGLFNGSAVFYTGTYASTPGINYNVGDGVLGTHNNPVTGLEIYLSPGTFSGTCSLYGELT
jgi:hypothetical protein